MQSAHQKIERGFVLDKRYRILEALGQGGMAYVYLAEDLRTSRHVALKLMRDELSDDAEFIRRFATEARAAASLDHPNIVQVLDYGQDGEVRYIVQEYVAGTNLKELIKDNHGLEWQVAVPIMIQIALGLEHAHKRGIIHRDMKPQNVLITPEMTAKVTDFGIARASIANTITLTGGMAFGSVHYFSPEQARGGRVTEASDLYSLGLMLYEMLTGVLPFNGESSVAVAIKQLQEMPVRPRKIKPQIPVALEGIIFKAIQKSPERRFASAREFVNELDHFMVSPESYRPPYPPQTQNWSSSSAALTTDKADANYDKIEELERNIDRRRRSRLRDSLLLVLIILIAVGGLFYLLNSALQRISLNQEQELEENVIVVKRYIGKKVSEINDELLEIYGENYELVPIKSETQEKGVIFEQDPNYGTKLKKDKAFIRLKYSVGQSELPITDVIGLTQEEARDILEELGLNVVIRSEYSQSVADDMVIRTIPEAGSTVNEGTRVILYVSRGSREVQVPDLIGQSWQAAQLKVEAVGMTLIGQSTHYEEGEVAEVEEADRVIIEQSPEADSDTTKGSVLHVTYGTAEDYLKVKRGIDLASEAGKAKSPEANSPDSLIMPNLIGYSKSEAEAALNKIWPGDAPPYYLSSSANLNSVNEEGAVVVRQSTPGGSRINPYVETLIISFDKQN